MAYYFRIKVVAVAEKMFEVEADTEEEARDHVDEADHLDEVFGVCDVDYWAAIVEPTH